MLSFSDLPKRPSYLGVGSCQDLGGCDLFDGPCQSDEDCKGDLQCITTDNCPKVLYPWEQGYNPDRLTSCCAVGKVAVVDAGSKNILVRKVTNTD